MGEMKEVFITLKLEALSDGGYLATSGDLPGLVAQGRTVAETLEIAQDVARKLAESYVEHGDELPPALQAVRISKAMLKIPVNVS